MKNLCLNPYVAYRPDGWYVGGSLATPITVSGFARARGVRMSGSTATIFAECPKIPVVVGTAYTGSVSVKPTFTGNVRTYLDYWNESGASLGDSGSSLQSVTNGTVSRVHSTATIPSGVTHASLSIYVNLPTAGDQLDITMHRLDSGADPAYFDGSSPGWQWLGPAGQSMSESVAAAKVWTGTAWVDSARRTYNGSAWAQAPA